MNQFEVGRIEVRVHGVRQDSPPKMSQIRYEVLVETDEPDRNGAWWTLASAGW